MTWKFAHASPTGFNFGTKHRRHKLSLPTGVFNRSLGNTHAEASVEGVFVRHSPMASRSPSEKAASRSDRCVLGVSRCPRYNRRVISAEVPVSEPHVNAKISPGRIPATIANWAINRSLVSSTTNSFLTSSRVITFRFGRFASRGMYRISAGFRSRYPSSTTMRKIWRNVHRRWATTL